MAEYTRDEAVAFIKAMQMTLEGKVGFRWMVDKLEGLGAYIERIAAENQHMHDYLDQANAQNDYQEFVRVAQADAQASDGRHDSERRERD